MNDLIAGTAERGEISSPIQHAAGVLGWPWPADNRQQARHHLTTHPHHPNTTSPGDEGRPGVWKDR